MAESNSSREFYLDEITKKLKEDPNSPDKRAQEVLNYLIASNKFTDWDVICFCAEYLGYMAGTVEFIQSPTKDLLRLIYTAHVARFGDVKWLDEGTMGRVSEKTEPPA